MSEENHQNFYYIIPAILIEDTKSPYIGFLYGLITSLCRKEGYCWATNEFLAEKLKIKVRAVQNHLSYLESNTFLKIHSIKQHHNP